MKHSQLYMSFQKMQYFDCWRGIEWNLLDRRRVL